MNRNARSNRRSYRRFDDAEYERRWERLRDLLEERDLDALLVYSDGGFAAHNVAYLSNYAPSFATYLVAFTDPDEPATLFVGLNNHLQDAAERAVVDDRRVLLPEPGERVADRLRAAGVSRVGIAGYDARYDLSLPHGHYRTLETRLDADLVDATVPYARLLATKGEAELDRIRKAADALDDAMAALERAAEPGLSERELRDALGAGVADSEGHVTTTFLSTAPMEGAQSGEPLPWKRKPASRTVSRGDVITTEVSAAVGGYASQIHRPYAVGSPPTDTYRDLYAVAAETYDAIRDAIEPGATTDDVADALAPIQESEFDGYDVMVHGYGGGYGPPHVGTPDATYWPGIDDPATEGWTFEAGEVLVVQPNVVTPDEGHGVQLGTTVVVTDDGTEQLHDYPMQFIEP
ncbi:M24 family metallopeptidase [Haloplanus salilacus]|uniref:M24 family metallopeptidase n=1 Tax=Haloplanus salilacus TaxID=2949994 RepID=UPI0030CD72DD